MNNIAPMYGVPNANAYGPPPNNATFYGMPSVQSQMSIMLFTLLKWVVIPIALIVGIWIYAKKKAFTRKKKWITIGIVLAIYIVIMLVVQKFT